jgi:aminoglycoside 3-N-acetyltransferase
VVTIDQLKADLRALGLTSGSIVMMHAAMSKIGRVEAGPGAVLEAILEVLGPGGTLMVPTFSYSYDKRDVAEAFDKRATPSCNNGILADILWKRPDAQRSDHPAYSVAAVGARAEEVTRDHPIAQPVGEGSPLHRLVQADGHVLLLGVGQDKNTLVHTAEALSGVGYTVVPFKESWGRNVRVKTPQGEILVPQREFSGCSLGFPVLEPVLSAKGFLKTGLVGQAACQFFRGRDLVSTVLEVLRKQPDFLLCRRPECEACTNRRRYLKEHGRTGNARPRFGE